MNIENDPLFYIWQSMKERCRNPNHQAYRYYGGRGIKVCKRWKDFKTFKQDMGPRPDGFSIDRWPNKDGDYKPSNCRWASITQQIRNRSNTRFLTYKGQKRPMAEWAEILDMPKHTLAVRLKNGWTAKRAIETPVRPRAKSKVINVDPMRLRYCGKVLTLSQWSVRLNIGKSIIYQRLYKGLPVRLILSKVPLRYVRDRKSA